MNIQNRIQFSTKTANPLPSQFPVSSGHQHRKNESLDHYSNFIESTTPYQTVPSGSGVTQRQSVFSSSSESQPPTSNVNSLGYQRWVAMRKLNKNSNSLEDMNEMFKTQTKLCAKLLESNCTPGEFTGSTGAKVLTPDELSSGYQAWAHQDQLLTAQPVTGGVGMFLLKKMGWSPGEGLGKYKKGNIEPISFRVKLDKRGLASDEDIIDSMTKVTQTSKSSAPTVKTLEGKHPVSLLGEYCSKRKIGAPRYEEFSESGPNNKKKYLFKVVVNGVAYKPTVANLNKKLAKIEAAQLCLQSIGVLP